MQKFGRTVVWLILALALAACTLPRGSALQSEIVKNEEALDSSYQVVRISRSNVNNIAQWPVTGWAGNYNWIDTHAAPSSSVIQTGDFVTVTIWDSQENSLLTNVGQKFVTLGKLEVAQNGTIFVPYISEIQVRGLTPDIARSRIQSRLAPIVPSAQVQIDVQQGASNSFDLVSGVSRPGSYPLISRNYTILSALSAGGGISPNLRNPLIRLIRGGKTFEITAEKLFSTASKNTILRRNDRIIVEPDKRAYTALGASGIENLIYFPKDALTALEALSLMGGLSETRADPKGLLVLREYEAKDVSYTGTGPKKQQVVFAIDLTTADGLFAARHFMIHPEDTVLATESPVGSARLIFGLISTVLGVSAQAAAL